MNTMLELTLVKANSLHVYRTLLKGGGAESRGMGRFVLGVQRRSSMTDSRKGRPLSCVAVNTRKIIA